MLRTDQTKMVYPGEGTTLTIRSYRRLRRFDGMTQVGIVLDIAIDCAAVDAHLLNCMIVHTVKDMRRGTLGITRA